LFRQVGALIEIIGMRKDLLRFFETDAAPPILPQTPTLARVKLEAQRWYNSYTTLRRSAVRRQPSLEVASRP
jgi:hypothetical protein